MIGCTNAFGPGPRVVTTPVVARVLWELSAIGVAWSRDPKIQGSTPTTDKDSEEDSNDTERLHSRIGQTDERSGRGRPN